MKAIWNDVVIAESDSTVVVDNNHYFPADSVNKDYLKPSDKTTVCGWKGSSNYYSLVVDGSENGDAVWCYAEPKEAAKEIKGYMAFWKGVSISQ
ncbi:MAG: hypothetical protein ACJAUP_001445 [Cellvibrionaceae bacterium]|jgi:uncharacterized protein (DUF427 family)